MKSRIILLLFISVAFFSCQKEKDSLPAGDISIIDITSTVNPVKAWDTTLITVTATGTNLQYGWEDDHGNIVGSGAVVKYAAGECCVGLNTISCRVFNDSGEVTDTIMIRVTSYFGPK